MGEDNSVLNSILAKSPVLKLILVSIPRLVPVRKLEKREEVFTRQCRNLPVSVFQASTLLTKSGLGLRSSSICLPTAAIRPILHRRHESAFSIMSVSSYGRVNNSGSLDPFYYGLVLTQPTRR